MSRIMGLLILLPFVGLWVLTIKIVDVCIKKQGAFKVVGLSVSLIVAIGSVISGLAIGPIVGWFILVVGVLIGIIGGWRSLFVTKQDIRLEEEQKLNFEMIIDRAKEMLFKNEIENIQEFDEVFQQIQANRYDPESSDLLARMKQYRKLKWESK